jgi:RNA recognition motif-containing protein
MARLFVGNLPYKATEAELKTHFEQAGEVTSVSVITDRQTGRARGFGFVEMADDEGTKKAVETLNGKEFQDRELVVNEARPMRNDRDNDRG